MPARNLETARRWFEQADTPDEWRGRVMELWDDSDADYYPARKVPGARPCHGVEQIARFLTDYAEAWTGLTYAIRDLTEIGDDRVLAWVTIRAEGRESGMGLSGDLYFCIWLRHGRIFRQEDHLTLRGALRALGLEGETLEAAGLEAQSHPG